MAEQELMKGYERFKRVAESQRLSKRFTLFILGITFLDTIGRTWYLYRYGFKPRLYFGPSIGWVLIGIAAAMFFYLWGKYSKENTAKRVFLCVSLIFILRTISTGVLTFFKLFSIAYIAYVLSIALGGLLILSCLLHLMYLRKVRQVEKRKPPPACGANWQRLGGEMRHQLISAIILGKLD